MSDEKLIFMVQYLKTDPKQSFEQFLKECIGLFQTKMYRVPNRGMISPMEITTDGDEIVFTQSKLCRPNNLFLWYEEPKGGTR